jgi:ABC-type bacteriocin/lantibiotic exporter with double-glycine peptidase domain
MLQKQIIELVERFASLSESPINHFELHDQKFRFNDRYEDSFHSFYTQLMDVAEFGHFHFEAKYSSVSDFNLILNKLPFPIIVFKKSSSGLIPMVIKHRATQEIEVVVFEEGGSKDLLYLDESKFFLDLKTYEELKVQNAFNPEMYPLGLESMEENGIIYLAGFNAISEPIKVAEGEKIAPFKRLLNLLKEEKKDIYILYFFAIMIALVNLTLPLGIQAIVGLMSGGLLLESVFVLMILVIVATMVAGWLQVQQLGMVEVLQQRLFAKTAFDFAYRIPRLKIEKIKGQFAPELVNRFFDVLTVQKSLPKLLIDFTSGIIQIIFGLLLLSFYHPYFILFGILVIIVILLVFYTTSAKGLETSIYESKYKYKVVYWLEELGRSLQSFKLAGDARLPLNKADRLLEKYLGYRKKHFKILVRQFSAIIAFKTIITAGLLILGGSLVFNEQINLGQFVASEIIIVLVINSVEKLIGSLSVVYDMLTALDKIGHVTDLEMESNAGRDVKDLNVEEKFEIRVNNLAYKYNDSLSNCYSGINFSISKGEKICVTGFNDSGKTSLVKTIAGLYQNYEGLISLNGVSLRELNINSYRSAIGDNLNLQDVFEGTIEENITLSRPGILLKDIVLACNKAGLDPFIAKLKEGLQTSLLPAGENLPSNVVKRILLARSFVQKPQLVIIDEFFHNVHSVEKSMLIDTILNEDFALLIVTTVPQIMEKCDRVLFMQDGKLIAEGTYQELSKLGLLPIK